MEKQYIRQTIKSLRAVMDHQQIIAFSEAIKTKLLSLESVRNADCIMAFYSHKNEPLMMEFIRECIDMGKSIALPCVTGEGEMIAAKYCRDSEMKNNVYGIPEPAFAGEISCERPDVIIVPGIAFDINLNRIGFGGGYYDRYLAATDAYKIGVCFDFQIVGKIDTDSHDVPMDIIVTEKRVIGEI